MEQRYGLARAVSKPGICRTRLKPAHLIAATEALGKGNAALCGAPAAAVRRRRACWGHFTAFAQSSVLRLVLRTQPRSCGRPPGRNSRPEIRGMVLADMIQSSSNLACRYFDVQIRMFPN